MRVDSVVVWSDDQTMIANMEPISGPPGEEPVAWRWDCVLCGEGTRTSGVETANAAINGMSVHLVVCPKLNLDSEGD